MWIPKSDPIQTKLQQNPEKGWLMLQQETMVSLSVMMLKTQMAKAKKKAIWLNGRELEKLNGIAKKVWASQRQSRLLKPRWIEVRLSNFFFEKQEDDQAVVSVTQMYRSNSFRDKSKKKFLLKRSDDGWQILNEINL